MLVETIRWNRRAGQNEPSHTFGSFHDAFGGATAIRPFLDAFVDISIHAPREGSDRNI